MLTNMQHSYIFCYMYQHCNIVTCWSIYNPVTFPLYFVRFLSVVRIPPIFVSVMSVVVFAVLLFVYNTIGRAKRWSRASENHYV